MRLYLQQVDILVMDEPFSGVDVKTAKRMNDLLMEMKKTLIMITHDVSEGNLRQFDEILYINNGRLVKSGDYQYLEGLLKKDIG